MPTFPLPVSAFADRLRKLEGGSFRLTVPVQTSREIGGDLNEVANGPGYWEGSFVAALSRSEGEYMNAVLDTLKQPGASFLFYMKGGPRGPQRDPDAQILANRRVTISAVETGRIRLANVPLELVLMPGDRIGWTYGVNPTRYALHRIGFEAPSYPIETKTSDISGITPWLPVQPFIQGSPTLGAQVDLVRPVCKAVMVKSSISGGRRMQGGSYEPISFSWVQTFR